MANSSKRAVSIVSKILICIVLHIVYFQKCFTTEMMHRKLRKNIVTFGFIIWMVLLSTLWMTLYDFKPFSFSKTPFHDAIKRSTICKKFYMDIQADISSNADFKQEYHELINLTQLQINLNSYIHRYDTVNGHRSARNRHHQQPQSLDPHYYNLSRPKTDHCNFNILINASNICSDDKPFMIILVPSSPRNIDKRRSIRNTWGQYARQLPLPKLYQSSSVKLVFVLGKDPHSMNDSVQLFESKMYRDIVFGDFYDTYDNLTRKMLLGLKWVNKFCPKSQYILKADDDAYVHIPRLVGMLMNNPAEATGCIYGKLNPRSVVQRTGKWGIPYDIYPMSEYPPYVTGGTYVISGNIGGKLLAVSTYIPYLTIEDAFITGVLRFIIGAYIEASPDFRNSDISDLKPCTFMLENAISANIRNVSLMEEMWNAQHQHISNTCGIKIKTEGL